MLIRSVHIITLEDPVEFVHPHKQATISQREMGTDFDSFSAGLRAALRQAPKIILIGEMRDRETVDIALSAAETGHLVLSTLHTETAEQTIDRILGMFNTEEERQIRIRLADTVRWIVCQRLLPKVGGGRIPAHEIMRMNLRIKDIIINGESDGKTFYEVIENGTASGMQTFEQNIVKLLSEGKITEDTALTRASRQDAVKTALDAMKKERGEETSEMSGPSSAGPDKTEEQVPEEPKAVKAEAAPDSKPKQTLPEPEGPSASPPKPPDTSWLADGKETAEDVPVALVLMKGGPARKMLAETFDGSGYQLVYPDSADDAIQTMQHNDYAAVVLHTGFEGTGLPDSMFHSHMNSLAMAKRHGILYILLGPDFHTLYDLEALALSANIVVNDRDVKHIGTLLMKAKSDHEALFGPYMEMIEPHRRA